ncbi:hypothetical protein [Actinomadura rubrisoli]|uniref:Uncharacterized protein n=1 Tax=Actinomadura rubrisoli TaxID=2530368 RepID=A0A4R5CC72_9ACTN|nr:hypothetical protein [Actinomadura rubrisoli]TDD97571.1 hypothetical protein E1298_00645 [Actinomadura rubrisoli]
MSAVITWGPPIALAILGVWALKKTIAAGPRVDRLADPRPLPGERVTPPGFTAPPADDQDGEHDIEPRWDERKPGVHVRPWSPGEAP